MQSSARAAQAALDALQHASAHAEMQEQEGHAAAAENAGGFAAAGGWEASSAARGPADSEDTSDDGQDVCV